MKSLNEHGFENWLWAQWLTEIWNPDKLCWIQKSSERRQKMLFYRTRGVVLHDRALNGEMNDSL